MKIIKSISAPSQSQNDKLFQIFNRYLRDFSRPHQSEEELIFDVVAEYMLYLMNIGNVPYPAMDNIEFDLMEEVRELYLKKTYGYMSLQEYRTSLVKRSC